MQKFTHLHVHTHYSLLDGLPKIDKLLDYTKKLKMNSVAITDHGTMSGAIEFYQKAKAAGIKPIIGEEFYMAFEGMDQKRPGIDDKRYHLLLLAKNFEGYQNLVQLTTKACLEGFYYKPRIDEKLLEKHSKGLICLTACIQGKIPRLIINNALDKAEKLILRYKDLFGKDNFYLEIQDHINIPEQKKANDALIKFSKKLDIPLIATNDVHYLEKGDAEAQDILMLVNTGADLNNPERLTMKNDDFSFKSKEEMIKVFKDTPEAIENTQKIVEDCNLEIELGKTKLPHFKVPNSNTPDEYLKELCIVGIKKRNIEESKEIKERLKYELSVIKQIGFASYFLIVQDFVNWAKNNGIVVGPGRGSAGGSLVAYLTNITDIDPLKYNLLFQRFLNPERIAGLPDIDLDFTDTRRDEVIHYVAKKYGKDKVSQIITFGTMAAKQVIRDVGRALNYEYLYCDKIAKMIPLFSTLDDALKKVDEFRRVYRTDPKAKKMIDIGKKLEGVARHASTHACGVVISNTPLSNLIPLQHASQNDQTIITQYDMYSVEELGLLKMDFLGLKNLTIIENALKLIQKLHNIKIDISHLPLNDQETYRLLQKGNSTGVFQFESDGMKRCLKELKPTQFEDIIAMVALYRPGPMELIPEYIDRKFKRKKIEYLHPKLKPILQNTYGVMIFQEQLMQVAQKIAGFSLGEADILRKAVGKKIKKLLLEQKEKMIQGMTENKIQKETAKKIWNWIIPFARYGFNRCLTKDTEIVNANTGEILTIQEIIENKKLPRMFCCDKNLKFKKASAIKVFKNGTKPIYKITTRLGKNIKASNNHPFLTVNGWKKIEELKIRDRIGIARKIPIVNKELRSIKKHHLIVLGYLLSKNNLCHPDSFCFSSSNKKELDDYKKALEKFKNTKAVFNYDKKATSIYAGKINSKEPSKAVQWIEKTGIKRKKAAQKEFPNFVFKLNQKQLSLLLSKMFQKNSCPGATKKKYPSIFYAASSKKLACQFQHLLLRLNIVSSLHYKKFKYRDEINNGYTININGYENLKNFHLYLNPYLIDKSKKIKGNNAKDNKDIIPSEIIQTLKEEIKKKGYTPKQFAKANNISERLFDADKIKKGYLRETLEIIGKKLKSSIILNYANSDIYWDEIIKIEPAGKELTYDLTIKDKHNFLANDFIVHNSHAAAYAMIAYETAYLKSHYPIEFMAVLMNNEQKNIDRLKIILREARKMKIKVLPPDINESKGKFTVVNENTIRFGLTAIKNVGYNVVEKIVEEREKGKHKEHYKSIGDFIERMPIEVLNKKSIESLIKAGAFDKLEKRGKLLYNLERLLEFARDSQKKKINGDGSLFGKKSAFLNLKLQDNPNPISQKEKMIWEKELLGVFVSSHPLEGIEGKIRGALPISDLTPSLNAQYVKVVGIVSKIKKINTRSGKPMLFVEIEDMAGRTEVIIFPGILERNPFLFQENKILVIKGRISNKDRSIKILCEEVKEVN